MMPVPDLSAAALKLLHEVFGYADFAASRPRSSTMSSRGGDALVLMPTGGGKSLCYQIPALCAAGPRHRRLAADRADEGPGRRAAPGRACAPPALNSSLASPKRREVEAADARRRARSRSMSRPSGW